MTPERPPSLGLPADCDDEAGDDDATVVGAGAGDPPSPEHPPSTIAAAAHGRTLDRSARFSIQSFPFAESNVTFPASSASL